MLIATCAAPPACAGDAQAHDVYVGPNYDDDTPGWGVTHFAEVGAAVAAVMPGGTIHLEQGTYALDSVLRIDKDCTIAGSSYDSTSIVAGAGLPVLLYALSGVSLECNDLSLRGSQVCFATQGGEIVIQRCELENFSKSAVACVSFLFDAPIRMVSSLVHGCGAVIGGGTVRAGALDVQFEHCTLADNSVVSAVRSLPGSGRASISFISTLMAECGEQPFSLIGIDCTFSHCAVWGSDYGQGTFEGVAFVDPQLDRPSYRISMASPLIDAGNAQPTTDTDICAGLRMVGRAPDIGAFEGGRVTLVHLTDLHLLAPVGDAIYVGVSYEPRLWDVDSYLAGIAASLPPGVSPDALIITGDIVDLASESSTYTTPLGSASRAQWDDTYLGYRAFKALCEQWFPNAPVFATVGNHDYREHPLYPWTWSDDQGISDAFLEELPYAPVEILPLGASLGIQTENDITLVMLNSGHDAIASSQLQQTELYPYLLEYALNGEHVIDVLHDIPPPNSVGQYVGMFAYGSGLGDEQLDVLGQYMALHPSSTYIIACHHPIVYDRMTIAYNIGEILDLCRQYPVSYVLSGHAHQPFEIEVQWGEEKETIFEIAGAAMSGQFALLFVPLGNVAEYDITYAHST